MIDWIKTEQEFKINQTNYKFSSTVAVVCDGCGVFGHKKIRSLKNIVNGQMQWKCMKCSLDNQETKNKKSQISRQMWQDQSIRNKIIKSIDYNKIKEKSKERWQNEGYKNKIIKSIEENKPNLSKLMKTKWANQEYRSEMMELYSTNEWKEERSKIATDAWKNQDYRDRVIENGKKTRSTKEYKEKAAKIRVNQPKVSSIQTILYSILDDLKIVYYREYPDKPADFEVTIGPYNFDCVIPLNDRKLLIECQGDYWHGLDKGISNDKAKATYIERYHPDCEIKYLWEHEFACKDKIIELVKYWVGITKLELVEFNFGQLQIKECPASDYKLLLSKYHYLANAGRGGMSHGSFGAYLGDELIAVCVFSPLIRQNIPHDYNSTRELSRLCIHPRYQKKNFASWFVSRCIKMLDSKYKTIISYCDTTFNHDGATYKACNFKLDSKSAPDYWYVSEDKWVMHKKTLYNHASKMGMTELEYATKNKYKKIYGKEKLKFIFER